MMVNQNRNTIDRLEKTEANNNSPEDLCFDPSDASITSSSDKSIPNNVLDVLVKLGDKKVNNAPKSTADTNNADQSNALLLEDTVSNLLDKIIEKRVNQRLNELGITDLNGSLNTEFIEEIVERHLELRLKDHNFTTQKEPSLKKKSKQSLKSPDITASKSYSLEKETPPAKEVVEEKKLEQSLKAPDITAPKNSSLKKKASVAKENVKRKFKYQPVTKEELLKLCRDKSIYLGDIDTSKITNMSGLFKDTLGRDFSGIEFWDVSNVTDMSSMFLNSSFNHNISSWNVSNVTDMSGMFSDSSFNQDISSWDVSNVKNMKLMFCGSYFNHDISLWDVSNVTDMSFIFRSSSFNQDISSWDVSKVKNMSHMFADSNFNLDISSWNVSNVKDMSGMFSFSSFNQDISSWNVSNVTDMRSMFSYSSFNHDISSWDITNVKNMDDMFKNTPILNNNKPSQKIFKYHPKTKTELLKLCKDKKVYLGDIDTSKIADMSALFRGEKKRDFSGIETWNVSNVTDMSEMFSNSPFNQNISFWDVSNVKDMRCMFSESFFNQDISSWDVSKVTDMRSMFSFSSFNHDISSWNISKFANVIDMFGNSKIESYNKPIRKKQSAQKKENTIISVLKSIFRDHE